MILTNEGGSSVRKICPSTTSSSTNLKSDWPGVEPSERPVTNHLYGQPLVLILNCITDDSVV
jgi:hypothetical protein